MSVLIQINGESAGEAVKELAELAAHLGGQHGDPLPKVTDKPARSSRSTPKPDPKPEQEEPPVQNDPDSEDGPSDDDAPVPTVVDLRAKAQEVGTTPEGKKAIKALLDEFESKSISDISEGKRAAFMVKLEDMA